MKEQLRVAVIGRTQWLYDTAVYLRDKGYVVPLVITGKAAPEYTRKSDDFKEFAEGCSADFYLAKALGESGIKEKLKKCDVGVSLNWMKVIDQECIDCFRLGILNAHMGDLPRYSGNACPNWALINGEEEIVISIHLMEGGALDCGRIITQARMTIKEDTYISDIYGWAEKMIPGLFHEALILLQKNLSYALKYADPHSAEALRCYPRRPEDSRIDWADSGVKIRNIIRASSRPFPGAYGFLEGQKIIVWRAENIFDNENYCAVPGQICEIGPNYFVVITGKGKLKISEWECEVPLKSLRQRLE